jgi:4-amino-4-deoxy-L-arabinose transferase-like glycosyltransferase
MFDEVHYVPAARQMLESGIADPVLNLMHPPLAKQLMALSIRTFGDNTTTTIAGHTYMSAWPSWPFLARPVWYLLDKIGDDRIAAVVLLGNPLILYAA